VARLPVVDCCTPLAGAGDLRELPVVCSLGPTDLEKRLADIVEVGAASLIARTSDGGRNLLRFHSDATTRQRLDAILAAEAACCAFLELSLSERAGELVLVIAAPEAGRELADGLAAAFGDGEA
jgi:hypothetical protein